MLVIKCDIYKSLTMEVPFDVTSIFISPDKILRFSSRAQNINLSKCNLLLGQRISVLLGFEIKVIRKSNPKRLV